MRKNKKMKVRIAQLDPALSPVQVTAEPKSFAKWSTGVVFTTLGGLGVATGITLTATGCSSDRGAMCTGGLITLGVSGIVTAGAIWLILDSGPKTIVRPLFGSEMGAHLKLGPGFVAGKF